MADETPTCSWQDGFIALASNDAELTKALDNNPVFWSLIQECARRADQFDQIVEQLKAMPAIERELATMRTLGERMQSSAVELLQLVNGHTEDGSQAKPTKVLLN